MKVRNNYLLQVLIYIAVIFIYAGTFIIIMTVVSDINDKSNFLSGALDLLLISIGIFVIGNLINYFINLFVKPKLFLYEEEFIYKDKTYKYNDIQKIEYNFGMISKLHSEYSALVLYFINEPPLKINHPSLKMIISFKKICNKKPFRMSNYGLFIVIGVAMAIIGILIMIFG